MAWEMARSCLTKEVSHALMWCRELQDWRYSSWIWDHWVLTWPRRKFSHPIWCCSYAANRVVGLAEGHKRRTLWEERETTKQEEMEGWVSTEVSWQENLQMADRKVADMQGCSRRSHAYIVVSWLWLQQGQWSLSHSCTSVSCAQQLNAH